MSPFLFLFSNKTWVIRAGIYKICGRIANAEDPVHTVSSEAVGLGLHCMSVPFWQVTSI